MSHAEWCPGRRRRILGARASASQGAHRLEMLFIALFTHAIALYNRFRSLPESLAREFAAFIALNGGAESLGNSAETPQRRRVFCRQRASGCTWAEHHALVDISREPWAHLFDAINSVPSCQRDPQRACASIAPTAEQLQDLVVRAQPAVLTGLLDGWPALDRWSNDSYLIEHLGRARVTVSVSEGRFDHPEPPSSWSLPSIEGLRGIVARPAHVPMTLRGALAAMHAVRGGRRQEAPDNLTAYVEYQPFDLLLASNEGGSDAASLAAVLSHDLRSNASTGSSSSGGSGSSGESERATAAARRIAEAAVASSGAPPIADDGMGNKVYSAPTLTSRGRHEIGALPAASWLLPRKQLLWLGGGGTIGSTHYDPYENLMAVVSGVKVFHLAAPEDGPKLGAFAPMAEGHLRMAPRGEQGEEEEEKSGGELVDDGAAYLDTHELVRDPSAIGEPLELHHYAPASLSKPAIEQLEQFPRLREANIFKCEARRGRSFILPRIIGTRSSRAQRRRRRRSRRRRRRRRRALGAVAGAAAAASLRSIGFTSRTISASSPTAALTARRIICCSTS